ncbi:MAG: ATP-binding protein [Candidatus Cloacimonetes bacterium]|nr:ATP-binding protein [Candidatus Cloacimonadota bacterium]
MMRFNKNFFYIIKENGFQLLFVILAFVTMATVGYIFISKLMRERLYIGVNNLLYSAEAEVKSSFLEAELTLLNSDNIILKMMERGTTKEELLDFLVFTTNCMIDTNISNIEFRGIYGFIQGEFYDGIGKDLGESFYPQSRPWYQTAVRNPDRVGYTAPYKDWDTDENIVSAVKMLTNGDERLGILAVDVNINWLIEFVNSLKLTENGHGVLLSHDLKIMAHSEASYLGTQLYELGFEYGNLSYNLRVNHEVKAKVIKDPVMGPSIVFFKEMFNGWYVGVITPRSQFFRDLYVAAEILFGLGILLSSFLCMTLLRLSVAKRLSDEESKLKSSFLAQMSHEIRTPLNAIIGLSEIDLNKGNLNSDSRSSMEQIYNSGNSLLQIINDILDLSKIEAGSLEIISNEYNTALLINDTINLNKVRIGTNSISLKLDICDRFPARLCGDEIHLKQILNNLLSNAIKYTREGFVSLEAKYVHIDDKTCNVVFIVSDSGIGIRKEDMDRLFSQYTKFDVEQNKHIEGTGLGLPITKKLVEMMHGTILVESTYGKGSIFTVTLPQEIIDTEIIEPDIVEKLKNLEYSSHVKKAVIDCAWMPYGKVLVVDDLQVNLIVAAGLLEPYGLTVEKVDSGAKAIELVKSGEGYDIIFIDHMMPEMDGIETMKIIRTWETKNDLPQTPIIALTANAMVGNKDLFISKGFNGFMAKPIDTRELDEVLNLWIKDKQDSDTLESAELNKANQMLKNDKIENQKAINNVDKQVIEAFLSDASKSLSTLADSLKQGNIKLFRTTVHGLKTVLAIIGEEDTSKKAFALEQAAEQRKQEFIKSHIEEFINDVNSIIECLTSKEAVEEENEDEILEDIATLSLNYKNLIKACAEYDDTQIYEIINLLKQSRWKKKTMSNIDMLYKMISLHSDFDGAIDTLIKLQKDIIPNNDD